MGSRAIPAATAVMLCTVLLVSGCPLRQRAPVETPAPGTVIASGTDAPSPDKDAAAPDKDASAPDQGSQGDEPADSAKGVATPVAGDDAGSGNPQETIESASVRVGDAYDVCLRENRTTPFKWTYQIEPAGGAEVLSDDYVPDPNPQKAVGSGGTHVWTFSLPSAGEVKLTFELGAEGKEIVKRRTCVLTVGQ